MMMKMILMMIQITVKVIIQTLKNDDDADEKNDFNNFGDEKADDEKDLNKNGQSKSDDNTRRKRRK